MPSRMFLPNSRAGPLNAADCPKSTRSPETPGVIAAGASVGTGVGIASPAPSSPPEQATVASARARTAAAPASQATPADRLRLIAPCASRC